MSQSKKKQSRRIRICLEESDRVFHVLILVSTTEKPQIQKVISRGRTLAPSEWPPIDRIFEGILMHQWASHNDPDQIAKEAMDTQRKQIFQIDHLPPWSNN